MNKDSSISNQWPKITYVDSDVRHWLNMVWEVYPSTISGLDWNGHAAQGQSDNEVMGASATNDSRVATHLW